MNSHTQPTSVLEQLMTHYAEFSTANLPAIMSLYQKSIVFTDPVSHLQGKPALERYFTAMAEGLDFCRFEFDQHVQSSLSGADSQAALFWTMHYAHPSVQGGKPASLSGSSHIRYTSEGIYYHRDYYDLGEMLYERLPVIGSAIRLIKRRMERS
ncbi:nuclear transport factor 2 family protein [Gilvimarinus algae]|uniref:Nuclear transport factor 2 family protein n=1 Tax=Gilvimarinus algae TaxID=3058037 RepID=A0ABT8TEN0_9GAMM|nr:nuclear transport factor 2 family protein [Gilvimarinus sp. SDUM040014]MDO3382503.1 nuclear transport factor 2 family protein [Gilvimarinus sp. SDUM040014]